MARKHRNEKAPAYFWAWRLDRQRRAEVWPFLTAEEAKAKHDVLRGAEHVEHVAFSNGTFTEAQMKNYCRGAGYKIKQLHGLPVPPVEPREGA